MKKIEGMKKIQCRYQHYTKHGVEWTNWFDMLCEPVCAGSECKARLKELKSITPKVRMGKLGHEYRIVEAEKL